MLIHTKYSFSYLGGFLDGNCLQQTDTQPPPTTLGLGTGRCFFWDRLGTWYDKPSMTSLFPSANVTVLCWLLTGGSISWLEVLPAEPNGLGANSDSSRISLFLTPFPQNRSNSSACLLGSLGELMSLVQIKYFKQCLSRSRHQPTQLLALSVSLMDSLHWDANSRSARTPLSSRLRAVLARSRCSVNRISLNSWTTQQGRQCLPWLYRGGNLGLIIKKTCSEPDCHWMAVRIWIII